jgi:hypothetical protein
MLLPHCNLHGIHVHKSCSLLYLFSAELVLRQRFELDTTEHKPYISRLFLKKCCLFRSISACSSVSVREMLCSRAIWSALRICADSAPWFITVRSTARISLSAQHVMRILALLSADSFLPTAVAPPHISSSSLSYKCKSHDRLKIFSVHVVSVCFGHFSFAAISVQFIKVQTTFQMFYTRQMWY